MNMSQGNELSWQTTLVLCLAILIFGGGTFILLALGKPVPDAVYALDGGLANAVVGVVGFFTTRQMHAASLWHLAQAQTTGVAQGAAVATGHPITTTGNTETQQ